MQWIFPFISFFNKELRGLIYYCRRGLFLPVIFSMIFPETAVSQPAFTANYLLKSINSTAEYINSQLYDDGTSVGVGTAYPGEKLDVNGNIRATGSLITTISSPQPPLVVNSSALVNSLNADLLDGLHASDFSLNNHAHSGMLCRSGHPITSQVAFWAVGDSITGEDALFWDFSTNRLGIGIDAPEADLHLYNGSNETSIYISETHFNNNLGLLQDSKWGVSNQSGKLLFNHFDNNNSLVNVLTLSMNHASGLAVVNGNLRARRIILSDGAQNNYVLSCSSNGLGVWKDPALLSGWSINQQTVFRMAGRVGIGTSQPTARLSIVAENMSALRIENTSTGTAIPAISTSVSDPDALAMVVEQAGSQNILLWGDGRIYASKIRIKVPVFPDYVFDSSYSLLSIPELESYLKEHQHLPDFPDSETVKSSGLDLGEINTLLVKKVEELNLYIIQLQNQIDQLRKRVASIEEDI